MSNKAEVRARVRASRRAGPAADAKGLADQAWEWLQSIPGVDRRSVGATRVTAYASYGTEPDTTALIARLREAGVEVLLPRVEGEALAWGLADDPAEDSKMGIREPQGTVSLLPLQALLIPALAVTVRGDRLGKGGGFYDRLLQALDGQVPVAAIVRDQDVLATLPVDAHDQRVHAVITPTRILRCTPSRETDEPTHL